MLCCPCLSLPNASRWFPGAIRSDASETAAFSWSSLRCATRHSCSGHVRPTSRTGRDRSLTDRHAVRIRVFRRAEGVRVAHVDRTTDRGVGVRFARRPTALVAVSEPQLVDRKSTRLNSSHSQISYAVFCLKKKKIDTTTFPLSSLTSA